MFFNKGRCQASFNSFHDSWRASVSSEDPSRLDDLPADAARDKEIFGRAGPRSSAIFPFRVGGKVTGAIAFGTVAREREWPDVLSSRLRPFVEIIGNAIAQVRVEETMRKVDEQCPACCTLCRARTHPERPANDPFAEKMVPPNFSVGAHHTRCHDRETRLEPAAKRSAALMIPGSLLL